MPNIMKSDLTAAYLNANLFYRPIEYLMDGFVPVTCSRIKKDISCSSPSNSTFDHFYSFTTEME